MYSKYFVLITDTHFGVFEIESKTYPDIFLKNIKEVQCLDGSDINSYLLEKVGRNNLSKYNYIWYLCLGEVYSCCKLEIDKKCKD